jgi:asparagine synthase (glutamine-hydrolysing)
MTRYCSKPVQTFSIGFEEESKEICELRWAHEVSKILGTDHHEIIVTLKDVFALFRKIVFQLDEPIADPACFPTFLLAEFAKRKVTVVLTGEGGDELFAGYPLYGQFKSCLDQERRLKILPLEAKKIYVKIMSNFDRNKRAIKKLFMKNCGRSVEETYPGLLKIFSRDERHLLYKKDLKNEVLLRNTEAVLADMFRKTDAVSDLDKMLFVDTRMSLPEALLMKIDKMTMLNSLEARVPFLDPSLAGFIATLPEVLKVRGTINKYLLKRYLAEKFPKELFTRPKQGLILPLPRWLRAEDGKWKELLFDGSSITKDLFDHSYIETLWKDFMDGNDGRANQIWTLAVLNVWYDLYFNRGI